jgi:dTDP-glucose 4,6-dehydratase
MTGEVKRRMKRVLVTGGAGFIGCNFVRYLLAQRERVEVVNLDALTYAGSLQNLRGVLDHPRHHFVHGDIRDRELVTRLLREHAIDTIVHFAAESHVDRSILGPAPFVETNLVGTFNLLESAREVWGEMGEDHWRRSLFHHISTDEVYGSLEPDDPPFSETTPYAPNSPYAASKAGGDHLVRAYGHTYGLPVTISNCSNNYGPYQYPEKLIPLMILNALEGKPLPIYGDGRQVRDWLYVEDHCAAILLVLEEGRKGEVYNIGGGNQPTNLQVVELLCGILDELLPGSPHRPHASLIRFVEDRPGHDRRYAMDFSKIERELGWRPRESLQSGLRRTVRWYLDNLDWVEAIRAEPAYEQWLKANYGAREENP